MVMPAADPRRGVRADPALAHHLAEVFRVGAYWSTHNSWRCAEVGWVRQAGTSSGCSSIGSSNGSSSSVGSSSGSSSSVGSETSKDSFCTPSQGGDLDLPSSSSSSSSSCCNAGTGGLGAMITDAEGPSACTASKAAGCWGGPSSSRGTMVGSAHPPARHPLAWARCQGVLPSLWGGLGCLRPAADADLDPAPGSPHPQEQQAGVLGVAMAEARHSGSHRAADDMLSLPAVEVGGAGAAAAAALPLLGTAPAPQGPAWRAPQLFDAAGRLIAEPAGEPAWEAWYFAVGPADWEWLAAAAPQLRQLRIT